MSQARPSIIPADYDYSDYVSGSGEAGSQESQGLVTRSPHKRGQSRDRIRGQEVYEDNLVRDDVIPVNWSKHRRPETRRSYAFKPPPYSYRYPIPFFEPLLFA